MGDAVKGHRDLLVWQEGPRFMETRIYSVLSFPRRRESSQIKRLGPRLRGDDELIRVSLGFLAPPASELTEKIDRLFKSMNGLIHSLQRDEKQ